VRRALSHVRMAVVAGNYFPRATVHALEQLGASDPGITVVTSAPTLYPLMMEADVAITTGGQTTYELAATGTPACAVVLADNQYPNLTTLSSLGTLDWVGSAADPDLESRLERQLVALASDSERRHAMSRAGRRLVDGKGAGRVAREILGMRR
jgi:UDP-2,4-diacetamido-2,4,6-trideoxy-beta-L-altropyranose hydrolase